MDFVDDDAPRPREERMAADLHALQQPGLPPGVQVAGIFSLGKNRYAPAIPTIEGFLQDADPTVRAEALKVLIRYYKLDRHWETARQFLLYDPSNWPRIIAAELLGEIRRDTNDPQTLALLANVVLNAEEEPLIRGGAYTAMEMIRHYDRRIHPLRVAKHLEDIPDVDWPWVKQCATWTPNQP